MGSLAKARAAGASDLPDLLRLYGQLNPDDPELHEADAKEIFRAILASAGLTLMVLDAGDQLVATAYLNVIPNLSRQGAPYAVIENVVVDQARRGTGLGKQLMAATLHAAWAAGCYKAMLLTGSKRPSTLAFYRACGFIEGDKTGYVAHPEAPAPTKSEGYLEAVGSLSRPQEQQSGDVALP